MVESMKIKNGCTRKVFLIGKYAIKIPQIQYGWTLFLKGLLGNMQEVAFSKIKDPRMAPIFFYVKGGFLVVMPRCEPLSEKQFDNIHIEKFWEQKHKIVDGNTIYYGDCKIPVEHKISSFGWYRTDKNTVRLVAIDYGS